MSRPRRWMTAGTPGRGAGRVVPTMGGGQRPHAGRDAVGHVLRVLPVALLLVFAQGAPAATGGGDGFAVVAAAAAAEPQVAVAGAGHRGLSARSSVPRRQTPVAVMARGPGVRTAFAAKAMTVRATDRGLGALFAAADSLMAGDNAAGGSTQLSGVAGADANDRGRSTRGHAVAALLAQLGVPSLQFGRFWFGTLSDSFNGEHVIGGTAEYRLTRHFSVGLGLSAIVSGDHDVAAQVRFEYRDW